VMNARNADAVRKQLVASIKGEKKDLPSRHEVTLPQRSCDCFARLDVTQ